MIHTDGKPTIANGAGDSTYVPSEKASFKLQELQGEQAVLLAKLERLGNEIALVIWADAHA